MDNLKKWNGSNSSMPLKQLGSTENLAQRYIATLNSGLIRNGLVDGMTTEIMKDPNSERLKVIANLQRGGENVGQLRRTISPGGMIELSKIELAGKTGLLDPIYAIESNFIKSHGLDMRTATAVDATRSRIPQYYPGAMELEGNRWAYGPQSEGIASQSASMLRDSRKEIGMAQASEGAQQVIKSNARNAGFSAEAAASFSEDLTRAGGKGLTKGATKSKVTVGAILSTLRKIR